MITSKYNWKNIEKEPDDGFFEVTKKENITALAAKSYTVVALTTTKN